MSERAFWVPEHPAMPIYAQRVPVKFGKLGEMEMLATPDIHGAWQFETKEECEAWIAANPHPVYVARQHAIMTTEGDRHG